MKKRMAVVFSMLIALTLGLCTSSTLVGANSDVFEFGDNRFEIIRFDSVETDTSIIFTAEAKLEVNGSDSYSEPLFLFFTLPYYDKSFNYVVREVQYNNNIISRDGWLDGSQNVYLNDELGFKVFGFVNGAHMENTNYLELNTDGKLKSGTYKMTLIYSKDDVTLADFNNAGFYLLDEVSIAEEVPHTIIFGKNVSVLTPALTNTNGDTYTGVQPYVASVNYDSSSFKEVLVDGAVVDASNFDVTVDAGNTTVVFKDSFMQSLENKEHTIKMTYTNGVRASGTFTVNYTVPLPTLTIINVNGDTYTGEKPYVAKVEYDDTLFKELLVDGEVVDTSNYEVTAGSTIVTFKDSYMQSLTNANHTITINYTNGAQANGIFKVNYVAPSQTPIPTKPQGSTSKASPATGDTTNITMLMTLSLISLSGIIVMSKKKEQ